MSKFRYCKDDKSFEAEQNDKDWNDGLDRGRSLREIAYQLKRIADFLEQLKHSTPLDVQERKRKAKEKGRWID